MTAYRLRCYPVRPIDPESRKVWVPMEDGTAYYHDNPAEPWVSVYAALYDANLLDAQRVGKLVSGDSAAMIYRQGSGYVAVAPELYEVSQ
jgi:hypothetical protein